MSEIIKHHSEREGYDEYALRVSLKGAVRRLFEPLKSLRFVGTAALLLLTPQEHVTAKNSIEPFQPALRNAIIHILPDAPRGAQHQFQPVLRNVIIHIKKDETLTKVLNKNGIAEIFKKHGLNTVESRQALTLLERYIDDLIKSGKISRNQIKSEKDKSSNLSKLFFETKVPYTDGDEKAKEYAPVVISAFTPKNAKKYDMKQIASWSKSIAIIKSFMEFEDVMQAKQFAKEMKNYVSKRLSELAPDFPKAEKEKLQKAILSLAIVSAVAEFNKEYADVDISNLVLHEDPEKAIVEFVSKNPGWAEELKKQIDIAISEAFPKSK